MATDYQALGRYAEAIDRLQLALSQRHYLLATFSRLASGITSPTLEGNVVPSFNVAKALEIVSDLEVLEGDIDTAIRWANANAIRSGRPAIIKSG